MDEDENVVALFLCVDGIVNTVRGLGDIVKKYKVVEKILISFLQDSIQKSQLLRNYQIFKI